MRLANAPVSFGVYGVQDSAHVGGADLARTVAELGYEGIDSGPIGLFGTDPDTIVALHDAGLRLSGGWVDLPFSDADAFQRSLPGLERALDLFEAVENAGLGPVRPMLADSGSPDRAANPGGGSPTLDGAGWKTFASSLRVAANRVRVRGLEPTFHHHVGTFVETVTEIERFLDVGDVGLTLDTGHLLMAGGDPVDALERWSTRIDHIHLKDVDLAVFQTAVRSGADLQQAWRQRPFVPLGAGDLQLAPFLDRLVASGYDGWVIVEQDVVIQDPGDRERARGDQRANRQALSRWFPLEPGDRA